MSRPSNKYVARSRKAFASSDANWGFLYLFWLLHSKPKLPDPPITRTSRLFCLEEFPNLRIFRLPPIRELRVCMHVIISDSCVYTTLHSFCIVYHSSYRVSSCIILYRHHVDGRAIRYESISDSFESDNV